VKTLHPKVHGGLLQRRDNDEDIRDAKKHEIPVIDIVAINLFILSSRLWPSLG